MGFSNKIRKERKIKKNRDLKREVTAIWGMKNVIFIPIVIGALAEERKEVDTRREKIRVTLNIGHVQNTAILGTERILKKVLET